MDSEAIKDAQRRLAEGIDPRVTVKTITPVQVPGRHETLAVSVLPDPDGPLKDGDRRLIVDVETLEALLDLAKGSYTKRVVLHKVALRVELRETPDGHRYELWKFVTLQGGGAAPERSLVDDLAAR